MPTTGKFNPAKAAAKAKQLQPLLGVQERSRTIE
jgi:hypothetical protein